MNRPNSELLPPIENLYVSTAQVALALGVSVTTVKRWVDDGILPAHRTAGGHRKLLVADLKRAVNDGNLPQADLSRMQPKALGPSRKDPSVLRTRFLAAVDAVDADGIRAVIHGGYQAGLTIAALADQVIAPAMRHLGHEWVEGRVDVVHEHRVTQACATALFEMRSHVHANAAVDRPVALGGAPEHDHYILPTLLAKLTLLECGWDAINLGPHTPFSAFCSAMDEFKPRLVWLTASHLTDPAKFLVDYAAFYVAAKHRGIAIAIGGNALTESLRVKMPYTTYGDGMEQLAAFARMLDRRPQRPKRGRPPKS